MTNPTVRACVGLGANLGDARAALASALTALQGLPLTRVVQVSSVYRTAPIDSHGPDYYNAVAMLETALDPHELLVQLQAIESGAGRERPYRNAPRTLDLDVLLYGELRLDDATLTVPHPRLHQRAFVLAPLAEIAPDLAIVGRGRVQDLLAGVSDQRIERINRQDNRQEMP